MNANENEYQRNCVYEIAKRLMAGESLGKEDINENDWQLLEDIFVMEGYAFFNRFRKEA